MSDVHLSRLFAHSYPASLHQAEGTADNLPGRHGAGAARPPPDRGTTDHGGDTATKETLTAPRFEALLAVQDLDTALDQHTHRRSSTPERAELATLDGQLASVDERLVDAAARRDEVAGREARLEADLAATEARIAEVNKRLYGGTVSATRELMAMTDDVKSMERRAADLEERALEVLEEREPLDAEVAAIEGERASLVASRSEVEEQLGRVLADIDREVDALNEQRAKVVGGVPDDLLAVYTRLRSRLGGTGAARLVGSSCGGCHLTLPATELDQLKHQPADALVFCDQCGRILIR